MTMKENVCDSKSFTRETHPLTYGSKQIYELDGSRMNISSLAFETKVNDDNLGDIDEISMDSESGNVDSPGKDDQDGLSDQVTEMNQDQKQISPEHKILVTVEEFAQFKGNESRDCSSDLFETVPNVFTDKNVLECELPELEVMKDICVDDGRPENGKKLFESLKDDKSTCFSPENPNDTNYCEAKESLSVKNSNGHTANQCWSEGENGGTLTDQERFKSDKDAAKHCDPQELAQIGEANCAATNSSEEDSLPDKELPIQVYLTQRTFPNFLDGEGNKLMQPSDQIPIGKAVSEGPAASSPESNSLLYNSKVESRSITFNFSDTGQVQCTANSMESLHKQSLTVKDKNPDGSSVNSKIESASSKNNNDKNVRDANSDDLSSDDQAQSSSEKSQCLTNDDVPAVEPDGAKQERGSSGNDTAVSQWQYDQGETSFSAVTYSGPIALAGSLSYRSDASTTSTRSFAFPVLQSEWNNSPVRMAKPDRRHFRKQKGWRSGILCCRF